MESIKTTNSLSTIEASELIKIDGGRADWNGAGDMIFTGIVGGSVGNAVASKTKNTGLGMVWGAIAGATAHLAYTMWD